MNCKETITIDIDQLRKDMLNESCGAFFGGGFGGALIQAVDIINASDEKIAEVAMQAGINLRKYQI